MPSRHEKENAMRDKKLHPQNRKIVEVAGKMQTKFEKKHGWPSGMKKAIKEDRKLGEKRLKNI